MKNFEPYLEEPKEDPWWKRLYAAVFLSALLSAVFAGMVFFHQTGAGGGAAARERRMRNLQNVERSNARIYFLTKAAAIAGAATGVVISVYFEIRKK